jgi:hypothetical protein
MRHRVVTVLSLTAHKYLQTLGKFLILLGLKIANFRIEQKSSRSNTQREETTHVRGARPMHPTLTALSASFQEKAHITFLYALFSYIS